MQAGREVKYQVWIVPTKEMKVVTSLRFDSSGQLYGVTTPDTPAGECIIIEMVRLRQFTGLRDKNGKEIYEGDIALIYGDRCVIEYDSKSASYVARTKIDSYWALDEETFKLGVEVIGNIYENPELLEVE